MDLTATISEFKKNFILLYEHLKLTFPKAQTHLLRGTSPFDFFSISDTPIESYVLILKQLPSANTTPQLTICLVMEGGNKLVTI